MTPALWHHLHLFVLTGWLLLAMWQDLRARCIPNGCVLSGAGMGLLLSFTPGPVDWACSLAGGLLGGLSLLWMYALRWLGAGDVKLIGMVGLFLGAPALLDLVPRVLLTGGLLSLGWALWMRLREPVFTALQRCDPERPPRSRQVPYALAIGLGTFSHLAATWPTTDF